MDDGCPPDPRTSPYQRTTGLKFQTFQRAGVQWILAPWHSWHPWHFRHGVFLCFSVLVPQVSLLTAGAWASGDHVTIMPKGILRHSESFKEYICANSNPGTRKHQTSGGSGLGREGKGRPGAEAEEGQRGGRAGSHLVVALRSPCRSLLVQP